LAVLLGRPPLWGLERRRAADGVRMVMDHMRDEMVRGDAALRPAASLAALDTGT